MKKIPTPTRTPARICCGCRRGWRNWRGKITCRIRASPSSPPMRGRCRGICGNFRRSVSGSRDRKPAPADFFITTTDVSGQARGAVEKFPPGIFWRRGRTCCSILWSPPERRPRTMSEPPSMFSIITRWRREFQVRIAGEEKNLRRADGAGGVCADGRTGIAS